MVAETNKSLEGPWCGQVSDGATALISFSPQQGETSTEALSLARDRTSWQFSKHLAVGFVSSLATITESKTHPTSRGCPLPCLLQWRLTSCWVWSRLILVCFFRYLGFLDADKRPMLFMLQSMLFIDLNGT